MSVWQANPSKLYFARNLEGTFLSGFQIIPLQRMYWMYSPTSESHHQVSYICRLGGRVDSTSAVLHHIPSQVIHWSDLESPNIMQADLSSSIVRRNFPEKMSGLKIEESLGFTIFLDFPFGQFGPIFRANSLLNFQGKTWPFEAPLKKKHPSNFDFHQFFFWGLCITMDFLGGENKIQLGKTTPSGVWMAPRLCK